MDFDYFSDKAVSVHGYRYDYSKVSLVNNKTPVEIICGEHGSFMQTPDRHLRGSGCKKCSTKNRSTLGPLTKEEFISLSEKVHGGFYSYSRMGPFGMGDKVLITCPIHGDFETLARKHLQERRGCPDCGRVRTKYSGSVLYQDFFDRAVDRHGSHYDYSDVSLRFFTDDIWVTCPEHGPFQVTASGHIHGRGCPGCRPQGSSPENELAEVITGLGFDVLRNSRDIIAPLELDIVLPNERIAFEFNGIFWHSEQAGKQKGYHQRKTEMAVAAGFRLFHVYESDWDLRRDYVIDRVREVLKPSVYVDTSKAYAIQEYCGRYALVLRGEVIAHYRLVDGVACEAWSKSGPLLIYKLMEKVGTKYLKTSFDWPEFTAGSLFALGFRKFRNVGPERMYFDKKTLRRLKEKPADASFEYLSVVDSGSAIWVVEDRVQSDE